jgi:hypothetical protein
MLRLLRKATRLAIGIPIENTFYVCGILFFSLCIVFFGSIMMAVKAIDFVLFTDVA